jgi:hypothetical protein
MNQPNLLSMDTPSAHRAGLRRLLDRLEENLGQAGRYGDTDSTRWRWPSL